MGEYVNQAKEWSQFLKKETTAEQGVNQGYNQALSKVFGLPALWVDE
jgi:hypothetical protein